MRSSKNSGPEVEPVVSIVVVTYRSWDCLARCLESLLDGHAVPREIVVVDNDGDERRADEFRRRFAGVSFVASPENLGFAHGCNLGAAQTRGELLLFVNPDVRVEPGELDRLLDEAARDPELRILAPTQVDEHGRMQKAFDSFPTFWSTLPGVRSLRRLLAPARWPHPRRRHDELVRCDWVTGAALLIRRADLERLGGWSEAFWMYHEDVDLCRRARDRGWEVACTPRATFVHEHGGSTRGDEATEARTRSETTISRHVYVARHRRGAAALVTHALIAKLRFGAATIAALANVLTVGRVRRLRIRARVWFALLAYYAGRDGSDGWLSPRSPANRRRRSAR